MSNSEDNEISGPDFPRGILDNVSQSKQTETLRSFNPQQVVLEFLESLSEREKDVIIKRYGLEGGAQETLEAVGKKLNLTRERIRQVEKSAFKKLAARTPSAKLQENIDLVYQVIDSRGGIFREDLLLHFLLPSESLPARQSVLFILALIPQFSLFKENGKYHRSWTVTGFEPDAFEEAIAEIIKILEESARSMPAKQLIARAEQRLGRSISMEVFESFAGASRQIDKNPYDEWGLAGWPEITPKDVGDKAHLVLKHNKEPMHFENITENINREKFDERVAHKETVHNELIKDKRFVLVGRGIYALKEWGYKRGTVASVITEIISKAAGPLSKKEIIEEVMRQRMVKRNTIIVGLSNKRLFKKTEDNKYTNVQ